MELPKLRSSLQASPTVNRNGYTYFVHPLTDGVPPLEPSLLDEVTAGFMDILPPDIDKIVGVEAMGLPVAVSLSLKSGKPLSVVRKRKYGLEGEVEVCQRTGYAQGKLYINGIHQNDRILLIDDVLSTGGTLDGILGGIRKVGAQIMAVGVVVDKSSKGVRQNIEMKYDIKVYSLVRLTVDSSGVHLLS